ncbi:hypothetical protein MLD38_035796 [Melastoma candidum]|uniref:Uncharacterized protein n=1 Tax=Melastoma candidum TaxID=119954 RepID=A0ACB9LID6_9MYRT|nr:hypothetical protein MLD38_035796 [Melastoma candidum]
MVVNGRPVKRLKSRVTANLHDFLTFPPPFSPPRAPFRSSVRDFLSTHALSSPPPPSPLMTWLLLFRLGHPSQDSTVSLHVVQEDVPSSSPRRSPYCDHCRVVGWSGHPVCRKRYHFIIKSSSHVDSVGHAQEEEEEGAPQERVYQLLEDTTHLLHGVVHSNGFGHLLRVNGREGGSRILSGGHIMDFWDRLCHMLGVRKVSVMDVSKKFGLEYRLLHAVIKDHPWYGEWGYEFGTGSFGLSPDGYDRAVKCLSGLPLSSLHLGEGEANTHLQSVISFYKSLSKQELVSVRDLFSLLMRLIHESRKSFSKPSNAAIHGRDSCSSGVLHQWADGDIERAEAAMIKVLRAVSGLNWVASRALRGAVCRMASPELLDYCLKDLEGRSTADGMVMRSRCSPNTGSLEYRLEPGNGTPSNLATSCSQSPSASPQSEENLLRHLRYLYQTIFHPQSMSKAGPHDLVLDAAQKILDCKQFVKDYKPEKSIQSVRSPFAMAVSCEVEPADQPSSSSSSTPPEIVILSSTATVSDLKHQASMAFRDVYLMYRRFQAEEVPDLSGVDDSTQVRHMLGTSQSVRLRGRCFQKSGTGKFGTERGMETWTVDCSCGARDDDGERMLACDVCGVWQHTRCLGIPDLESVPARFVCWRRCGVPCPEVLKPGANCKGEVGSCPAKSPPMNGVV